MRRVMRRGNLGTALVVSSGMAGALALAAVAPSSLAGAATSPEARGNPAVVGRWSKAFNPGSNAVGISATLLHNGRVLIMGDENFRKTTVTSGYLYNPVTNKVRRVITPAEVFCGGMITLSDGRMLTVGGTGAKIPIGLKDIWLFNPATRKWIKQPDTPLGRYYPTIAELPSGRVLIVAGTEADALTPNPKVEIYTPPRPGRAKGTLRVVGPEHTTGFYPKLFVMPDGRVLEVKGFSAYRFDPASPDWKFFGRLPAFAGPGAAGMMLPGGPNGSNRVISVGGLEHGKALAATEIFNYANPTAGWHRGHRMPTPRAHMNLVQVPNGTAYGIGGNRTGLYGAGTRQTLFYNPAKDTWRGMAVESVRRAYHSTALLLPDGRILAAGDTGTGGGGALLDIYSPPYLFHGTRPVIHTAPTQVKYGAKFKIGWSGKRVTRAVLMAPGSTTHADEMQARHVELRVTRTANGFVASAPPRAAVAPPGYYMLFVVTKGGVPSKAKWIHVGPR